MKKVEYIDMNEREISLVDLMVEILLRWRMIIVWMIAGAVILGAFSYIRSGNAASKQQEASEEMASDPEEWLTEEEIQNVDYVVNYEKLYLGKKEYREKAPLMQMDFNNVGKAEATIVVEAEDIRKSEDIARVYKDVVESGEFFEKVAGDVGMETIGMQEILFLNRVEEKVVIDGGESTSTFKIAALHSDEEKCKAMLESAIAFLRGKKSDVAEVLGEHEISVVNESFAFISNTGIADRQRAALDEINSMKKSISDMKDQLSDTEKAYYNYLTSDEDAETEETEAVTAVPTAGVSVKYVLLGAVMAAFVYAFILLLIYIFNTKIRETDSLQELYGIPQLGVIPAEPGKKKAFGFVDKWILSIRDHNKRQFSSEEALELAAVAAKMAAGKENLKNICLMGCGLKERSLDVCEKMKARLERENIQAVVLNNVLYDAQMLEELEKADGAVLVEGAKATLYNEIAEELELLNRQGIKVLGGILVG